MPIVCKAYRYSWSAQSAEVQKRWKCIFARNTSYSNSLWEANAQTPRASVRISLQGVEQSPSRALTDRKGVIFINSGTVAHYITIFKGVQCPLGEPMIHSINPKRLRSTAVAASSRDRYQRARTPINAHRTTVSGNSKLGSGHSHVHVCSKTFHVKVMMTSRDVGDERGIVVVIPSKMQTCKFHLRFIFTYFLEDALPRIQILHHIPCARSAFYFSCFKKLKNS